MKKWSALALMLALIVALLAGCGDADPEKVAARVVAEVNGVKVTRGEAQKLYEFLLPQTVMMYAEQGTTVDPASSTTVASVKATALGILTEGIALEQKLTELGGGLTDEDREEMKTAAQEEYEQTIQGYVASYGVEEADAKVAIDEMGYTEYAIEYSLLREAIETRLLPYATEDLVVSDEEIQAKYDELVASAEAAYAESPAQFINDVMGGSTVYAQPEGFRYVKNLVLSFPEDVDALISEKDNEYYDVMIKQFTAQSELQGDPAPTDERKAELEATLAGCEADFDRIQAEIDALKVTGFEKMKPEAEEVLAKAQAEGADFDALIAEYSSDQPTGIMQEKGYPVNADATNYVQSFTDGAMALKNIGDVSDLIESDYGYHILQYASDVTTGAIPFEELKDTVSTLLLTERQDDTLYEKMTEWIESAKIKTYINKF